MASFQDLRLAAFVLLALAALGGVADITEDNYPFVRSGIDSFASKAASNHHSPASPYFWLPVIFPNTTLPGPAIPDNNTTLTPRDFSYDAWALEELPQSMERIFDNELMGWAWYPGTDKLPEIITVTPRDVPFGTLDFKLSPKQFARFTREGTHRYPQLTHYRLEAARAKLFNPKGCERAHTIPYLTVPIMLPAFTYFAYTELPEIESPLLRNPPVKHMYFTHRDALHTIFLFVKHDTCTVLHGKANQPWTHEYWEQFLRRTYILPIEYKYEQGLVDPNDKKGKIWWRLTPLVNEALFPQSYWVIMSDKGWLYTADCQYGRFGHGAPEIFNHTCL